MNIDREKLTLLVYKYTGLSETAREAQAKMEEAHREANAVMDEISAYLEEVNAANKKMEDELSRLRKAEAEQAEAAEAVAALHTCRECKFFQRGPVPGATVGFCMHIGPEPIVDRDEDADACGKFEPSIATLATKAPVPSLYIHTCGECLSWAEDKMECNGTGTCLNRNCRTAKRGKDDPSCIHFEPREEPAAKTGKPTEEGPEVSCIECKHSERVDMATNTWRCKKGIPFCGFWKVRCKDFEQWIEKPHCGLCKNFEQDDRSPDIGKCPHDKGSMPTGRWGLVCDKFEEAKP